MCVHRLDLEVWRGGELRQRALQVIVPEPEPVHPRVDLEVITERGSEVITDRGSDPNLRARRRDWGLTPICAAAAQIGDRPRFGGEGAGGGRRGDRRGQVVLEDAVEIA